MYRKTTSYSCLLFLFAWSCTKNTFNTTELVSTEGSALLKIAYVAPSVRNQGVQVKINGERISHLLNYSFGFPGGGSNIGGANASDYLSLAPGQATLELSLPKVGTNTDSVVLYSSTVNLVQNARQTLFITDTFPAISSFLAADTASRPDSGFVRLRFAHAMPDVPAVDVYKNAQLLFSNVPFKGSTGYITTQLGSDTIKIRAAGALPTVTPIVSRVFTNANQRVYTFLSRGYRSLTGTRGPQLSSLLVH